MNRWTLALTVFRKELVDALRDRRTLLMVFLSSVAMGPLSLVLLSTLVSGMEKRAEEREVTVQGMAYAPSLRNYFERQTFTVREAPADFEAQIKNSKLGEAVLIVPPTFEADLARGDAPTLVVVTSAANQRAQGVSNRLRGLLQGFNQEQAQLRLSLRGVPPVVLNTLEVQVHDLADPATRGAQLVGMLPFFVLMAVLYGALTAALDTTAGERERGSLEPLLANPAGPMALVLGKWAAVASVSMLIALLSCFSFLPGQWLLRSETLAALFRYGPHEALAFLLLLLPLAAALSAVLMAIAIRCKTFKEAHANGNVLLIVVSLLPLVALFGQEGEARWHLWVPALAQVTLMGRVLKGEALLPLDVALTALVCAVVTAAALAFVVRRLRDAALR
jgi:sodium transport system permease protein